MDLFRQNAATLGGDVNHGENKCDTQIKSYHRSSYYRDHDWFINIWWAAWALVIGHSLIKTISHHRSPTRTQISTKLRRKMNELKMQWEYFAKMFYMYAQLTKLTQSAETDGGGTYKICRLYLVLLHGWSICCENNSILLWRQALTLWGLLEWELYLHWHRMIDQRFSAIEIL